MHRKSHIAVLCGGQSAEHEVSIESAKNIVQALDKNRYEIAVIFVTRQGEWIWLDSNATLLNNPHMQPLSEPVAGKRLFLRLGSNQPLVAYENQQLLECVVDVVFPVLHGAHGEDGTLQGLLELLNIPYVGPGTLGSAVCMDKEFSKHLLASAGIPVSKWIVISRDGNPQLTFATAVEQLGLPLFVKPANTGSSVGVSKVRTAEEFTEALELAWQYDHKIIIEECILGREVECAVLGNYQVEASLPGEIIPHHEFYSYEAKYLDPDGATLKIPADLEPEVIANIQSVAKKAFAVLGCAGMARVDFFLTPNNQVYVNEANTLPGFTQISMYPKMWMASGLSYSDLIDQLINLAIERFAHDRILVNQPNRSEQKADLT